MKKEAARAIRKGINLGRLMAVEAALDGLAPEPYAWQLVEPYGGIHQRLYRRAIDRAADSEATRIVDQLLSTQPVQDAS